MPADPRIRRLRSRLLRWGRQHFQAYPWRAFTDPYAIIVAEFMLHRTQVRQVLPVYKAFMTLYPSLEVFARHNPRASERLLEPLGLRWRIEGMLAALQQLWRKHRAVPANFDALLAIQGIGQYIAGATICFSQNTPVALIDTNTVRVIGRVFGLDLRGEARRKPAVVAAVGRACDPHQPRNFYYALIDLAHDICRPAEPHCDSCPLLDVPCAFGRAYVVVAPRKTGAGDSSAPGESDIR